VGLFALVFYFSGCGLPSSAPPKSGADAGTVAEETVVLNIQALDGPLEAARVRLVSLQKGVLGSPVFTQPGGEARIELPKSVFDGLDDADLLYFYVDSVENTRIQTGPSTVSSKPLVAGQAKLRSYLPRVQTIKSRIELFKPLDTAPDIKSSTTVSHFSNARAVILEQQLKKAGTITAPLTPESVAPILFTTEVLDTVSNTLDTIATQLENPASDTARKFRLLATATKAILERDIKDILLFPSQLGLEDSDAILLELAENGADGQHAFHPVFELEFASLSAEISKDLTDTALIDSVGSASAVNGLLTITDQEVRAALDNDLVITAVDPNGPSITASTSVSGSVHFLLPTRRMSDSDELLRLDPGVPSAGASFAVQTLIDEAQSP